MVSKPRTLAEVSVCLSGAESEKKAMVQRETSHVVGRTE